MCVDLACVVASARPAGSRNRPVAGRPRAHTRAHAHTHASTRTALPLPLTRRSPVPVRSPARLYPLPRPAPAPTPTTATTRPTDYLGRWACGEEGGGPYYGLACTWHIARGERAGLVWGHGCTCCCCGPRRRVDMLGAWCMVPRMLAHACLLPPLVQRAHGMRCSSAIIMACAPPRVEPSRAHRKPSPGLALPPRLCSCARTHTRAQAQTHSCAPDAAAAGAR